MTIAADFATDAEATRAIKVVLRKALFATQFGSRCAATASGGPTAARPSSKCRPRWSLPNAAASIPVMGARSTVRCRGNRLSFDRYNAAACAAERQARERTNEEYGQRQRRESEAVRAAELARRDVMRAPPTPRSVRDPAQDAKAYAAFEELRERAETDVARDTANASTGPVGRRLYIIEGELLEVCIELGLLRADDKPIARLWAAFADPRKPGQVLREHNPQHGMPEIACRGFQLHAGGERGPTSDILFEAQREPSGAWQFGPSRDHRDYHSPRHREWERLVRERERYREIDPRQIPQLDEQIAAIDAKDAAAAQAHNAGRDCAFAWSRWPRAGARFRRCPGRADAARRSSDGALFNCGAS